MAMRRINREGLHRQVYCSICTEVFTDPRFLPCHHTFCMNCIKDLAGRHQDIFPCPNCRKEVNIPPQEDFEQFFHKNYYILSVDLRAACAPPTPVMTLKVLIFGDPHVGKTALFNRYSNKSFEKTQTSIQIEMSTKVVDYSPDLTIHLELWDIPGFDQSKQLVRTHYRNSHGCLLLFDLTKAKTFLNVVVWKEELDKFGQLPDGSPIPCLLLGNKCDVANEHQEVNVDSLDTICRRLNFLGWRFISAKENLCCDESLSFLLEEMVKKMQPMKGMGERSTSIIHLGPTVDSDTDSDTDTSDRRKKKSRRPKCHCRH